MKVSVTPLTPELMHMLHTSAQNIDFTVAAAASVLRAFLSGIQHQTMPSVDLTMLHPVCLGHEFAKHFWQLRQQEQPALHQEQLGFALQYAQHSVRAVMSSCLS